jgi:hypothetical protein
MKANGRFQHEHTNNSYSVLAGWSAELFCVASLLVTYIPGAAIGYFMAGFPGKAFPFMMLLLWMVSKKHNNSVYVCMFAFLFPVRLIFFHMVHP